MLLGAETYSEAVDLWGVGCIFAELLKNEPLFPARTGGVGWAGGLAARGCSGRDLAGAWHSITHRIK